MDEDWTDLAGRPIQVAQVWEAGTTPVLLSMVTMVTTSGRCVAWRSPSARQRGPRPHGGSGQPGRSIIAYASAPRQRRRQGPAVAGPIRRDTVLVRSVG